MYVCIPFECLMPQKTRSGCQIPLGLELQTVMSCHVGAWNQTQVSCKSRQAALEPPNTATLIYFL